MTSGGARNRSGPQPDPNSLKSQRIGLTLTALPAGGFEGEIPAFPLPAHSVPEVAAREAEVWTQLWRTPQACAWIGQAWRWPLVALYTRTRVICEGEEPRGADLASLHRLGDQIGMTPAGLKENGWRIAEVTPVPGASGGQDKQATRPVSARDRLKMINGGQSA